MLKSAVAAGRTVIIATHDVELTAEVAHQVVVLADGEVVAAGAADEVLTASTMFAPMTSKVLSPLKWLTVSDIRDALAN